MATAISSRKLKKASFIPISVEKALVATVYPKQGLAILINFYS